MKTSTRRVLFLFFAGLFLISAPLVALYAEGYRLDWSHKSIVKTGALYLESKPAPLAIHLNQKLKKKTYSLFPSLYIGNLIPKTHLVQVKKDGYFSWQKNLTVFPKLVTEAKNIVLFPKNPKIKRITSNVENFYFAPSNKYIAVVEKNTIPQINLYATKIGQEFLLFLGTATSSGYQIPEIQWSNDSSRLAFRIEKGDVKKWFVFNIENDQPENTKVVNFSEELEHLLIYQLEWSPSDRNLIFITADDMKGNRLLFDYNLQSKKLSAALAQDVYDYIVLSSRIMYISQVLSTINSLDPLTSSIKQELYNPLFHVNSQDIKFIQEPLQNRMLAVLSGKEAYLMRDISSSMSFEKISEQAAKLIPDSSAKKLMIVEPTGIELYWLGDIHVQPFRNAGDRIKILRADSPVLDAVWFSKNNEYIIYSEENSLKVVELDMRDTQNVYEIAQYPRPKKLYYEEKTNNLYFLSESTLYQLSLNES